MQDVAVANLIPVDGSSLEGTMTSRPDHVTDPEVPCQSLSWQFRLLHKQWPAVGKPGSLLGRGDGLVPQSFYFQRGRLQPLDLPGTERSRPVKISLSSCKDRKKKKQQKEHGSNRVLGWGWKRVDGQDINIENPERLRECRNIERSFNNIICVPC